MNRKILFFVFVAICSITKAQIDREFWFAIPKENSAHGSITVTNDVNLKITAQQLNANVTISMPLNGSFVIQNVTIPAGTTKVVSLATSFAQFGNIYSNPGLLDGIPLDGSTNRGLHIVSDNDITVYYDYNNYYNRDLFSLKGKNGLGTEFYTPFQNIWANGLNYKNSGGTPVAYSEIDIVATADNTVVTITPSAPTQSGHLAGVPYTVTLMAGQTYSVAAKNQTAAGHLTGTHITSTQPIAVTTNDDSVGVTSGSCYDINGDQLIPVPLIGSKYLVMCGTNSQTNAGVAVQNPSRGEQVFVVATQAGTVVTYQDRAGTILRISLSLTAGGSDYMSPDITQVNQDAIYINATKPVYVYHITGIACETGGAILPPITNCTGSNSVSFYRAADLNDLTLNLMVPYNTSIPFNDATQPYNFFTVTYLNGTTASIPGSWFEPVPNAGWAVLTGGAGGPRYFGTSNTFIPKGQAVKITNSKDFFHLGITNGTAGQTDKYGYFSSFNVSQAKVGVSSTETNIYTGCLDDTIQLSAHGGLGYTWHYGSPSGPSTYLDDPTSPNPKIYGLPSGSHDFYVEVTQTKCFGTDTLKISVNILPKPQAAFQLDKSVTCVPSNVGITNVSTGNSLSYTWDLGDGTTSNSSFSNFTHQYRNTLTTNVVRFIKLLVQDQCGVKDSVSQNITLYPEVHAQFTSTMASYCSPRQVYFVNNSNAVATKFIWNFGDNTTCLSKDTTHIYTNNTQHDTTYNAYLVAISNDNCKDSTAKVPILVYPSVEPYFALDKASGCNPVTVQLTNGSTGPYTSESWDFNDGTTTSSAQPKVFSYDFFNMSSTLNKSFIITLKINYKGICQKTYSKPVTVYASIVPKVSADITTLCNNTTIVFKDSTNRSPVPYNYKWDFGDGGSAIGTYGPNKTAALFTKHQYENFQTVYKTLKATFYGYSQYGCSKDTSIDIVVFPNVKASFSFDTPAGCSPMVVPFKNGSTPTATWVRFWDDEDKPSGGFPYTYLPATQTYSNNQDTSMMVYHPKLKVAYLYNQIPVCADSLTNSVQVYSRASANFSADKTEGTSPLTVSFTNNSKNSSAYFWDFSDNATSTSFNPIHEFVNKETKVAEYSVKLSASNPYCTPDTSIITIKVKPEINTGIPISKSLELKFYPNPTKDKINIEYTLLKSSNVIIELLESSGRLINKTIEIKKKAGNNITCIDLSGYKGTLFFIKILWNGESTVLKVIKED